VSTFPSSSITRTGPRTRYGPDRYVVIDGIGSFMQSRYPVV